MIEFQPGNMYAIKVALPGIHHEMGSIRLMSTIRLLAKATQAD